ncbi:MAG: class I SAM-dependent methyltransferase [Geminicoccaceae bacterium]
MSVAERLRSEIKASGPVSLDRFMDLALTAAEGGYYRATPAIGRAGDFVTAPEISQLFGEMIGAVLAQAWIDMGRPPAVNLVECGPGHGTLMEDLLRATRSVPGFHQTISLHLVETSPSLREAQRTKLEAFRPTWHDRVDDLPNDLPVLGVANEFFDALPCVQWLSQAGCWRERRIGLDEGDRFMWTLGDRPSADTPALPPADPGEEVVHEISRRRCQTVAMLGNLVRKGGIVLIIDYGAVARGPTGDTLQAVRDHRPVDPLAEPGMADLSTAVDFRALGLSIHSTGARSFGPIAQATFLKRVGIHLRAQALRRRVSGEGAATLDSGLRRLLDPQAMGELFKVMAITAQDELPAGFTAEDRDAWQ